MQAADLLLLTPFMVLAIGGLSLLGLGVWPRNIPRLAFFGLTLSFLIAAEICAVLFWSEPGRVANLIVIDAVSRLFFLLFILGSAGIVLLSCTYGPIQQESRDEYYGLILFATLGMALLGSSAHLLTAFLGLEILSVPLFALVAWKPARAGAVEAGIKYAMLTGVAVAFFIYGMALIYAETGSLEIGQLMSLETGALNSVLLTGVGLLIVAIGFKLAIVPFHMWAPDIYQAAPAPVTALFATIAKVGVLVFLIRLMTMQWPAAGEAMQPLFWILAATTMTTGNILALLQDNLKRLLAYSSIAHIGYIMVAFAAGNSLGGDAAIYYGIAYVAMNLGVFGVVAALAHPGADRERLEDYRGLGLRHPGLGLSISVFLLALAGLPPTAGFMAKFLVFGAAIEAQQITLVVLAVLNTALSFYYYLRVILIFHTGRAPPKHGNPIPWSMTLCIAVSLLAVILLGVFPSAILDAL